MPRRTQSRNTRPRPNPGWSATHDAAYYRPVQRLACGCRADGRWKCEEHYYATPRSTP